jgi:hypothetical protein
MTTSERFLEIQDLFHAALKLPADERRPFLSARCPHDKALRDEVESLLVEDGNPAGVLHHEEEEGRTFTLPLGTASAFMK